MLGADRVETCLFRRSGNDGDDLAAGAMALVTGYVLLSIMACRWAKVAPRNGLSCSWVTLLSAYYHVWLWRWAPSLQPQTVSCGWYAR